jgi:NADH:ubiquinone oxidoreductase subunit H
VGEFWTSTLWPLIVMIGQSLLLFVVLLIAIAYILLAARKIWAGVQIRRRPNIIAPFGPVPILCRAFEVCAERSLSLPGAPTRAYFCWRRWSHARWW